MDKSVTSISFFELAAQADAVVQMVMFFLALASMWSWAIAIDKFVKFHLLKKRSDEFEELLEEAANLDEVYRNSKEGLTHPLVKIFLAGMREWKNGNIKQLTVSHASAERAEKRSSLKERISSSMQIALNRSVQRLEGGLNFLAIVGSSSPFIGLFGTVWGIMNSFQAIAVSKNTSLAAVAPGIAEALMATAFGLFTAIPAVLFYNIFSAKVNQFNERAENFSAQFLNALSQDLDNQ